MSDSTGAANIVRNKFETAQSYANDAWTSALGFLDNLGSVARLVYPDVGLPDLPSAPVYPAAPTAPDLPAVTLADVAAPTVPALSALVLDDIETPRFTVAPPDIVLPDMPELDQPQAPGEAPQHPGYGTAGRTGPHPARTTGLRSRDHPGSARAHHPHLRG